MGLRIRTNTESLVAQSRLSESQNNLASSMEKLSSGYRINRSSDDAAGLAVSESMRAKLRGLNQAKRNANDGISMSQIAEGGLNEITNIMIRLRELAVQAASDTLGSKERSYLDKEYKNLVEEVDRISSSTEYNGTKLLGKTNKPLTIQVGYSNSPHDTLGLSFISSENGINTESLQLKGTTLASEDRDEIGANLEKIDSALDILSGSRAHLGANQSRLNSAISNINVTMENMSAANSRIRDVDFAEETAKLTQAKILSQSGTAVLSQANQKSELALALLR